jgi:pimeloyl-ACP methyl ester carboxylesterase
MFQHGSPGSSEDVVWEADLAGLAEAGFAVIGMTDTLNREVGLNGDDQNTLLFTTLIQEWRNAHFHIQTWGDQMAFLRFIEALGDLDEVPLSGGDGVPDLDLGAPLTYVGISMGSIHGSGFLTYAPEIKAAALAVGSQRQGEQYFREGDFIDIFPSNLAELIPNATPTDYWTALSIFQMIFDHQDAHHQAKYLYRNPLEVAGTTRKASVLVVEGVGDTTVPNNATRSLAWIFGPIPHLAPIWEASPILEQVTGPVTGNIDAETTAAFYQFVPFGISGIPHTPGCEFEPNGHGCGQAAPEARLQRLLFLKSAVEDPVPTIVDPLSVAP